MAELVETQLSEPGLKRFLVNDPTVEKLGEILEDNPNGVLFLRDELTGLIASLDKPGQENARAFLLECWDGGSSFTFDRIGRGTIIVEHAIVSVLGEIQPGPLQVYVSEVLKGKRDDGLLQRFQLLVWPDFPSKFETVDREPDEEARGRASEVFHRLKELHALEVDAESHEPGDAGILFLHFAEDAQIVFNEWREQLENRLRSDSLPSIMESHLSKYRSLIPSLALLDHLVDGGTGPVGLNSLERAIAWGKYLETHANRIYEAAFCEERSAARQIASRIKTGDLPVKFTARYVHRKGWSGLSNKKSVAEGLSLLEELHWLRKVEIQTGGKPKIEYQVNPAVLDEPESRIRLN
jgi:putative DNA primase/helicase